jgi:enoyl-[acyl-carrier protein] reductase I
MMLMENKRVVVMGVANKWSIAWGIASKLKEQGAQIIYTYYGEASERNLKKMLTAAELEDSLLISCDVSSDESIRQAFEEIGAKVGKLDGIVHSIAHAKREELEGNYYDTSRDGYLMAQEISAYSLVAVTREALPYMSEGAAVVTLTYLGGERVVNNYNVMGVAKAALEASVRYLAKDLGAKGFRINALSAGPIKTLAAKGVSGLTDMRDAYVARAPLGRMVTHEDISNTALYLLSHLSSGVTGENIHVDCGYHVMGI